MKLSEFESTLRGRGWTSKHRDDFDKQLAKAIDSQRKRLSELPLPRFVYEWGRWRILCETREQPWRTVQKLHGANVTWFIDIPVTVPVEAIWGLIEHG